MNFALVSPTKPPQSFISSTAKKEHWVDHWSQHSLLWLNNAKTNKQRDNRLRKDAQLEKSSKVKNYSCQGSRRATRVSRSPHYSNKFLLLESILMSVNRVAMGKKATPLIIDMLNPSERLFSGFNTLNEIAIDASFPLFRHYLHRQELVLF